MTNSMSHEFNSYIDPEIAAIDTCMQETFRKYSLNVFPYFTDSYNSRTIGNRATDCYVRPSYGFDESIDRITVSRPQQADFPNIGLGFGRDGSLLNVTVSSESRPYSKVETFSQHKLIKAIIRAGNHTDATEKVFSQIGDCSKVLFGFSGTDMHRLILCIYSPQGSYQYTCDMSQGEKYFYGNGIDVHALDVVKMIGEILSTIPAADVDQNPTSLR